MSMRERLDRRRRTGTSTRTRSGFRRVWPLAGALVGALVVASASGAGHDMTNTFHLGASNVATATTFLQTNTPTVSLSVSNTNTGSAAAALRGSSAGTSTSAPGVSGTTSGTSGAATGVYGLVSSGTAGASTAGVSGHNNGAGYGVIGNGEIGLRGIGDADGVLGSSAGGVGVRGTSPGGTGAYGRHSNATGTAPGVHGRTDSTTELAAGVFGEAPSGTSTAGVYGSSAAYGVLGVGGAVGVVGYNPAGLAGYFAGNVHVEGTLSKSAGSFRIDHPLEPETKYLQHSFVESPDMKNVYDGVVRTDRRGFAIVRLPRYFSALNRSFRYQLTVVGRTFARAIVWREVARNRFTVRTNAPRVKVSWQVTGIRRDTYANAHRIDVEIDKHSERTDDLARLALGRR